MRILHYKEVIGFCLVFSVSFILMFKIVQSVDPITSTFLTYGVSCVFFLLLDSHNLKKTLSVLTNHKKDVFIINISTLVNTLLAYYVMTYVPPTVYVIVFFSCLPLFEHLLSRKSVEIKDHTFLFKMFVFMTSIIIAFFVSSSDTNDSVIGIFITMISSLFAVIYMNQTSALHKHANVSIHQVLSLRFILVSVICGAYSFTLGTMNTLTTHDIGLLLITALTGSIIPLFLMQLSIKKLGSKISSLFTPIIPVLCMVMMFFFGYMAFSLVKMLLVSIMSLMIFYQAKLELNKKIAPQDA